MKTAGGCARTSRILSAPGLGRSAARVRICRTLSDGTPELCKCVPSHLPGKKAVVGSPVRRLVAIAQELKESLWLTIN